VHRALAAPASFQGRITTFPAVNNAPTFVINGMICLFSSNNAGARVVSTSYNGRVFDACENHAAFLGAH
jgi:hypothetical protein